ncbi:MAG: M48 family metallopeptidase [Phycisphaerae bacterium]|nr:M48 family metallopeptidase [Phycisphaerae bacterium]
MNMKKHLEIEDVGTVALTRSRLAKNMILKINHDKTIAVTIPTFGTIKAAKDFINDKKHWIVKQLHIYAEQDKLLGDTNFDIDFEQAQADLYNRLRFLAAKYNFKYNRVTFRCQKTRWGSCSSDNNISLNINLALLPKRLQDYVILHELCHIRHKNHGRSFWHLLDKCTANKAQQLNKELNSHRIRIVK